MNGNKSDDNKTARNGDPEDSSCPYSNFRDIFESYTLACVTTVVVIGAICAWCIFTHETE